MKRIVVRVVPKAKQNKVIEEDGRYKVYVTAPAEDGRANRAVLELLADHFGIKKSQVHLLQGAKSRDKLVDIEL